MGNKQFFQETLWWKDVYCVRVQDANSIIKLSDGQVLQRCVYPNPDKTFTIVSYSGKVETNQNLVFACPVLSRVERPELLGIEII